MRFFLLQLKKILLILVKYGSLPGYPFVRVKNEVYFLNTKTIPKETLKYFIILTKSQKKFKIINLYCNSNFSITSQHFKILLDYLPSSSKDLYEKCDL